MWLFMARTRSKPASPPVPGDAGAEVTDEPVQVISRAAAIDSDARPARASPPLGTQAAATADLLRRRPHSPRRTAHAAPPRRPLALGQRHRHRDRPAQRPALRLTQQHPVTASQKGHPRARGTPATRHDSRAERLTTNSEKARPATTSTDPRSRNVEASTQLWSGITGAHLGRGSVCVPPTGEVALTNARHFLPQR